MAVTPNTVRFLVGRWEDLHAEATAVRSRVFVEEQGVPLEVELDDKDPECWHVLAYLTKKTSSSSSGGPAAQGEEECVVGTARLLPNGHIGRMAVLPSARGLGIGAQMLEVVMVKARELGHREVALSAQTRAAGFYKRAGFVPEGELFVEEGTGIMHVNMRRNLE